MSNYLIVIIFLVVLAVIGYGIIKYRKNQKNVPDESNDLIGDDWKDEQNLKDKKEYIDNTLNEIKDDVIKKTNQDEIAVKPEVNKVEPAKVVKPKVAKPKAKKEVVAETKKPATPKKAPAKKSKGK